MIKKFAKRLIKTYIIYQVAKKLNVDKPRVINTSYKAMLRRVK